MPSLFGIDISPEAIIGTALNPLAGQAIGAWQNRDKLPGFGPSPADILGGPADPINIDRGAFQVPGFADLNAALGQPPQVGRSGFRGGQRQAFGMALDRARGNNLVSAEQARQGAQQQIAAGQALAASARPGGAAQAARAAATNTGQALSALTGQRALAGAQEASGALGLAGQIAGQGRGQDIQRGGMNVQAALEALRQRGSLGLGQAGLNAQGEGLAANTALQQQQLELQRRLAAMGAPTDMDRLMQVGSTLGGAALLLSDERTKDRKPGAKRAVDEFIESLKPERFRYKDPKDGEGDRLGIMAQDLEKTEAGAQAVVETKRGKMVDTRQLAPVLTAALARLGERVGLLEDKAPRAKARIRKER